LKGNLIWGNSLPELRLLVTGFGLVVLALGPNGIGKPLYSFMVSKLLFDEDEEEVA
jgi:hypothetical protein